MTMRYCNRQKSGPVAKHPVCDHIIAGVLQQPKQSQVQKVTERVVIK